MKKDNKKIAKICATCDNCIYIGEGDYICDDTKDIVMEDHTPNDNYFHCGGSTWKEQG